MPQSQPPYPKQPDWFIVSPEAIIDGERLGVGLGVEDTVNSLRYMAKYSAPITDPRGNRRYRGYVLLVEGRHVTSVAEVFTQQRSAP